jgi:deoxycytidine triphosphate deaminase
MIVNNGEYDFKIRKHERIAQAVIFKVKGSGEYDGSYQEKQI